ncbi:Histone deacetylase HDT1 [Zea mays]|uniref:Histone deacetylase HDT1 n=1 Tax=Zea mays TaxID=4577 RepID=A0A3L6DEN3_MAIZE|nr:Histone deacetylase HDT1 [Zea mays]
MVVAGGRNRAVYALAQCTLDMPPDHYRACLDGAMAERRRKVGGGKMCVAVFGARCTLQYEMDLQFFNVTGNSKMLSLRLDVKPGSTVKCEPGYGFMLHLSQKLATGTLSVDKNPHIQFDLVFDKEFELSHTSKTTSVFFTGYKVEQPFEEDGYPFLFSIELVLFQVEVIKTFFVSLTSCLPSSTMDLDSEDEDEELNVPVVKAKLVGRNRKVKKRQFLEFFKKKDIFNNDLGGPYAFLEDSSDEDDTSDDEEEDTSTPKKHEAGKKRAAESSVLKTPLSDKKAKVATPSAQKTG